MADNTITLTIGVDDKGTAILRSFQKTTESTFQKIKGDSGSLVDSVKKHWLGLTAAATAAGLVINRAWALADMAAQFQEQKASLNALASQYGTSANQIISSIQTVSKGLISMSDAVTITGSAMVKGLSPDQIINLAGAAETLSNVTGQKVSDAFRSMAESIALGRSRGIEAAVGMIDLKDKYGDLVEKMSEAEKAQKMYAIVMERISGLQKTLGEGTDSTADKMERLTVQIADLKLQAGAFVIKGGLALYGILQGTASAALFLTSGIFGIIAALGALSDKLGLTSGGFAKWRAEADAALAASEELAKKGKDNLAAIFAAPEDLAGAAGKGTSPGITDTDNAVKAAKEIATVFFAGREYSKETFDFIVAANQKIQEQGAIQAEIEFAGRAYQQETLDFLFRADEAYKKQLENAKKPKVTPSTAVTVTQDISSAPQAIGAAAQAFGLATAPVVSALINLVQAIVNLPKMLTDFVKSFMQALYDFPDRLIELMDTVFSKLPIMISDIFAKLMKMFPKILESAFKGIINLLISTVYAMFAFIPGLKLNTGGDSSGLEDNTKATNKLADSIDSLNDSINKTLTDMLTGSDSPASAIERLNIAWEEVSKAKGAFAGATGEGKVEAGKGLQDALGTYLKVAQEAYQRPSTEYQAIFDTTVADLKAIQAGLAGIDTSQSATSMYSISFDSSVLLGIFSQAWEGLKQVFSNAWEFFKTLPGMMWNAVKDLGASIWNAIKGLPGAMWDAIKGIFNFSWPSFSWPSFPSFSWPSLPTLNIASWNWPSLPTLSIDLFHDGGVIQKAHSGKYITGTPLAPNEIPIIALAGEGILNNYNGMQAVGGEAGLNYINETGTLPKFHSGGAPKYKGTGGAGGGGSYGGFDPSAFSVPSNWPDWMSVFDGLLEWIKTKVLDGILANAQAAGDWMNSTFGITSAESTIGGWTNNVGSAVQDVGDWINQTLGIGHDGGMIRSFGISPSLAPNEVPMITKVGEGILNDYNGMKAIGGEAGLNYANKTGKFPGQGGNVDSRSYSYSVSIPVTIHTKTEVNEDALAQKFKKVVEDSFKYGKLGAMAKE